MRVNAKEHAALYKVFLNGLELHNCFEADDEEGWANCFVYKDGDLWVDEAGRIVTVTLTGNVSLLKVENETE